MSPKDFVHLHVHSHYSLLQALPQIKALVKRAKELEMDALALTDYGAMYGAIEFYKACEKEGIKPIIGQCAYLAIDRLTDKRPRIDNTRHRITLLARNETGYKNLLKLTTIAHVDGYYYRPRMDKHILREHAEGIIALSGGLAGDICKALEMDEFGKAESLAAEYADIFGEGNFYLELQDHPELDQWQARNGDLKKLAEKTGLPLVATKDVHYLDPGDAEAHDILLCIGDGKTVDQENRNRMTDADYSFISGGRIAEAFADRPEAIANTRKIADRCELKLELGKWYFAEFPIPADKTYDDVLREEAEKGIREKVAEVTPEITARVNYELDVIKNKGYAPYFLVVSDYMKWCKEHGIVATTRGSAAGSLVSYAIDIVPVNPLTYHLPFERFLNPFRPSPPDIDADIEDSRRDEVIAYVTEKYGKDKVAQIGTFGTLQARGAVRDVGRVLDLPYAFCDRVAKLIPMGSQGFPMTIERAIDETPELKDLMETDPQVQRLLDLAQRVEGSARHVSVHAAGVVIANKPLTEYTALQKETGGEKLITQYEMHAIEDAGVLKMDFLGLKNLSILGRAREIIRRTKGVDIDPYKIPLNDEKTYKMLGEGDTTGVFQLSGSGMTRYLRELKPEKVTDIMAMVALFRPGPMESIPDFIRRKHDPSLVKYLDPRMEKFLAASYGIITYQDDVMMLAIELGGYDWMEADKLRKAMGKKIPAEMAAQKDKLLKGFVGHGKLSPAQAQELWKLIEPFAAYGFNKAHAASYGMVAYQTAYLKANYLSEFMTAVLTADAGDADRIAVAVQECEKLGLTVLPPDINDSLSSFTYIDDKTIRFGLLAIKGIGQAVIDTIIAERKKNGKFASITDFASRIRSRDFNKKSVDVLIRSGALDSLGERNRLLVSIDQILQHNKDAVRDITSGQKTLFHGNAALASRAEIPLRDAPPASKREKLQWERDLLGLYVSEHPFREYAKVFGDALIRTADLPAHKASKGLLRVGGILMDVRQIMTKKNEPMAFAKLEDESGGVEVVVFPSVFGTTKDAWVKDAAVVVEGKYNERDGETKLLAEAVTRVNADTIEGLKKKLSLASGSRLPTGGAALSAETISVTVPPKMPMAQADKLKEVFGAHPGGRKVILVVRDGAAVKRIRTSFSVGFSGDLVKDVERVVGKGAVLA